MDDLISRHGISAWLDNMGYSKLADVVMDEDRFPSAQPETHDKRTESHACDLIDRQPSYSCSHEDDTICRRAAVDAMFAKMPGLTFGDVLQILHELPSAQPECDKEFVMLKVIDLNGRPYYSIIYLEDGREYEGYSSYDLMVISEYLKRYFGFAQPEIIRCRDCKHYYFADNRIPQEQRYVCDIGGEVWQPDDYCSFAERREVSE